MLLMPKLQNMEIATDHNQARNALPKAVCRTEGRTIHFLVGGVWRLGLPQPEQISQAGSGLVPGRLDCLCLGAEDLEEWDTSLLAVLLDLVGKARKAGIRVDNGNLPEGLVRLLRLAQSIPAREGAQRKAGSSSFMVRVGAAVLGFWPRLLDFKNFAAELLASIARLFAGRSAMRYQDLVEAMYVCGWQSLPIISITTLLFGLILAFVGAVQLTEFGAQVYVAGLVGIGVMRVMGAVMVGVVMSGRIGASYAAMLGSMQVNEEVDALSTLGISPVDFLVLPRFLALALMTPLLTIYGDLMGILGGYLVGIFMLGLNPLEYVDATIRMVHYRHLLIGLAYATFFGMIVATAGCYQGLRCGRSAQAVGHATTTAVVQSIVGIIVATAMITVVCNLLGV